MSQSTTDKRALNSVFLLELKQDMRSRNEENDIDLR